jgi:D-glycero-beta-D-manno-heptose-7-phosphate kinase
MDIQQPESLKVIVIGDACIDKYHYGHCERLSPEAPVPVLRHNHTEEHDGMCLNVVRNLISFGIRPDKKHNAGIISKERFVDLKTKQHLIRFDVGETGVQPPLSKGAAQRLNLETYDAVVISDYNKGFITEENAHDIAKRCLEHKIPLFVDSKKKDLSCFEGAILKINEKEFRETVRYPIKYELVVTLGAAGARWNGVQFGTKPCEVFDVSGAGDTFLAALVAEYLKTKSLEKAIDFANKCSRIVVQRFGTYSITEEDVRNLT